MIKFRRLQLKTYNLEKKISQNTKIIALIGQKSSNKHKVQAPVTSRLLNVKTALVGANDIIIRHWNIMKKTKKIKGILTKFSNQKLCKESTIFQILGF